MNRGRPCTYDEAVAEEVCHRLAQGEMLKVICRDKHMPPESTIRQWVLDDRDGFAARYAHARELGWHSMAEETIEIADETAFDTVKSAEGDERPNSEWISRSRLRVDSRRWLLSKMLPRVYGDKVTTTISGDPENPLTIQHGYAVSPEVAKTMEEWTAAASPQPEAE